MRLNNWPSYLPPPLYLDFETFTENGYNLRKKDFSTVEYILDSRFFDQCLAYGDPVTKTNGVIWHDQDIGGFLDSIDTTKRTLVCHRTPFDGKILDLIYQKRFAVYVCTESMARAMLQHHSKGFSLDAVHEALFGTRIKDDTLDEMRGIREVPLEMRPKYGRYAMGDIVAMIKCLHKMMEHMPASQWWHMDWCLRQFIEPVLKIDTSECDGFIEDYHEESKKLYGAYDADESQFASSEKFANLLVEHAHFFDPVKSVGRVGAYGGETRYVPTVVSEATKKERYDFAKKSEGFITGVLESDSEIVRDLGQLRLRAASSSELAQARNLKRIAQTTGGDFGLCVNFSGCATHRISGNGGVCGINVLAIKRGSRMRNALKAPKGMKMLSLDMSAFELGICRFLSQDKPAMDALLDRSRDLYVEFARVAYKDDSLTKQNAKEKREVGKTSELQLQYNSGAGTLRSQLLEKGAHVTHREAEDLVHTFRHVLHRSLYKYWRTFGTYIPKMRNKDTHIPVKNADFLIIEHGGIRLPNGLKLMFPDLQQRGGDWTYRKTLGQGYTRDKIYGGKLVQYCCQSLANVIIQEKKRMIDREFGVRIVHEVYDDITMVVPLSFSNADALELVERVVEPLTWWPELPLSAEYGMGDSWGSCNKETKVYGSQIG